MSCRGSNRSKPLRRGTSSRSSSARALARSWSPARTASASVVARFATADVEEDSRGSSMLSLLFGPSGFSGTDADGKTFRDLLGSPPSTPQDPIVQRPRTPAFHAGNTGSNPVGVASLSRRRFRSGPGFGGLVAHLLPKRSGDRLVLLVVGDGHVPQGGLDLLVPHQLLERRQRHAAGGAVGAERVPQRVPRHRLSGLTLGHLDARAHVQRSQRVDRRPVAEHVAIERRHELHRARDTKRRRSHEGRIPTWDELDEPARSALIAAYWRARSSYDAARQSPREVVI